MVSADNLNLDVLEMIFAHLSGNDLPSVALVSKAFLTSVIPTLYSTISYRVTQGKGYAARKRTSPFAAILSHPSLAVHVRTIEIRAIPTIGSQPHPTFIQECSSAIALCRNVTSFICTVQNILHYFLIPLQDKSRLRVLRARAFLSTEQAEILVRLKKIQRLSLEYASWNVVDLLPKWIDLIHNNLTSLTLFTINEVHENILEPVLKKLPRLSGLHIVGCPKINHNAVLRLVSHTPLLESLSLTTSEKPPDTPAPHLPHLRNLAFDVRYSAMNSPSSSSIVSSVLRIIQSSSPQLASFSVKLVESKGLLPPGFVKQLLEGNAKSFRRLAFTDCVLEVESLREICKSCEKLERLDIPLDIKKLTSFTSALANSSTLRTIIEVDSHFDHGVRKSLTHENARYMMSKVTNLAKVVTVDRRIWTGQRTAFGLSVSLERRAKTNSANLWFIPPQEYED